MTNMHTGEKPIVVVGSINIDLVAAAERIPIAGETVLGTDFHINPGGKGANQAVAIARLGYPVRMIGRLGDDVFGAQLRTHLVNEGVDLTGVSAAQASSGVAAIAVSASGENSIVVIQGANALLTPEYLEANARIVRSAGLVLTQLEIPQETVNYLAEICSREKIPLILDPAPARELPPSLLERIQWFTPNEVEAEFFIGKGDGAAADPARAAGRVLRQGVRGVVLKLGARGAYLASATGLNQAISPFSVAATDTTAAGDAFNGAFAAGLMLGKGPLESARFAAAAAAISVTRPGAQPSMPAMEEVERMVDS